MKIIALAAAASLIQLYPAEAKVAVRRLAAPSVAVPALGLRAVPDAASLPSLPGGAPFRAIPFPSATSPGPALAAPADLPVSREPAAAASAGELQAAPASAPELGPLQAAIDADREGGADRQPAELARALGAAFDNSEANGVPAGPEPVAAEPRDDLSAGLDPPKPASVRTSMRRLEDIQELRVGTYNILNLFQKVGKWITDPNDPGRRLQVTAAGEQKAEWQLRESAKAILESKLDVVVLQEVENIAALRDFNEKYLNGEYRTFLIEGNDERGIDVAFLVKKDIPFKIEQRTHRDEAWTDPATGRTSKLFSRDLPVLLVRAPGREKPLFALFGTHFKSKRDRGPDRESRQLRRAQVERAAEIVQRYRAEFGEDLPLMFAGDFNGVPHHEPEFESLRRVAQLTDSLDTVRPPLSEQDRITHTYHPRDGQTQKHQMDAIMVSGRMRALVSSAWVYRYRDERGQVKPIPDTYEQRSKNPSDHFPVMATIRFQPLLNPATAP